MYGTARINDSLDLTFKYVLQSRGCSVQLRQQDDDQIRLEAKVSQYYVFLHEHDIIAD